MKKPSARRQKLREKALAEYLTVPPEERAKRNREFVRKMREETQAWDDFQKIHLDGVMAHYAHAREKHPYFCDWIGPDGRHKDSRERVERILNRLRITVERNAKTGNLGWDDLLDCEVWEVFDALVRGDRAQAVEELFDCIAILLRAIDVLEGRQKLGKPEKGAGK